jgi:AraC family transcriptional regulator
MSDIAVVLKAIAFIETHLTAETTVADMAGSVSFSLYHFSRVFSRVTRHAPYDYMMRRRLAEAAHRLLESDEKLIDIATDLQFAAQESFSRAFKRLSGLPPRQVRQRKWMDTRCLLPRLTGDYLEFLNSGIDLIPDPVHLVPLRLAGVATLTGPADMDTPPWDSLLEELRAVPPTPNYRVKMYLPANRYMRLAGVPLAEDETPPATLVQKQLPGGNYAGFKLPPQPAHVVHLRRYVYHTWWPRAMTDPPPPFDLEYYPAPAEAAPAMLYLPC